MLLYWEDVPYNQEKALESFLEHVRVFLNSSDGKQLQISGERSEKREEGKSD